MKRLEHLFEANLFDIKLNGFTPSHAKCKYCGIVCYDIYKKIPTDIQCMLRQLPGSRPSEDRLKLDSELYNKYSPCITEDEYIIKNIIE